MQRTRPRASAQFVLAVRARNGNAPGGLWPHPRQSAPHPIRCCNRSTPRRPSFAIGRHIGDSSSTNNNASIVRGRRLFSPSHVGQFSPCAVRSSVDRGRDDRPAGRPDGRTVTVGRRVSTICRQIDDRRTRSALERAFMESCEERTGHETVCSSRVHRVLAKLLSNSARSVQPIIILFVPSSPSVVGGDAAQRRHAATVHSNLCPTRSPFDRDSRRTRGRRRRVCANTPPPPNGYHALRIQAARAYGHIMVVKS